MTASIRFMLPVAALCALISGIAHAADKPLPPVRAAAPIVPGAAPPSDTAKPPADAPAALDPNSRAAKAQDGVVVLERGGKVIALGTVLHGDGRIITAASALGPGTNLDARFSDGSVVRANMTHSDRAWDLALLTTTPASAKPGLKAARRTDASRTNAPATFSLLQDKTLQPVRTTIKREATFVGMGGKNLPEGLELGTRFKPAELGAPIVNEEGEVVAIVARACPPGSRANCQPTTYGAPVSAARSFLRSALKPSVPAGAASPPTATPTPTNKGWLGMDVVPDRAGPVRGVRLAALHPDSPARAAGLKAGANAAQADLLIAVDGIPIGDAKTLAQTLAAHPAGDIVELLLFGGNRFRQVSLMLRPAPDAGTGSTAPQKPTPNAPPEPARPAPTPPQPPAKAGASPQERPGNR